MFKLDAETAHRATIAVLKLRSGTGFTPEPHALCHGFLIERWHDDAKPLGGTLSSGMRDKLLRRIGEYLGFRARSFPARTRTGASAQQLHRI